MLISHYAIVLSGILRPCLRDGQQAVADGDCGWHPLADPSPGDGVTGWGSGRGTAEDGRLSFDNFQLSRGDFTGRRVGHAGVGDYRVEKIPVCRLHLLYSLFQCFLYPHHEDPSLNIFYYYRNQSLADIFPSDCHCDHKHFHNQQQHLPIFITNTHLLAL